MHAPYEGRSRISPLAALFIALMNAGLGYAYVSGPIARGDLGSLVGVLPLALASMAITTVWLIGTFRSEDEAGDAPVAA